MKLNLKQNYNMTMISCYIGYITQAVVNNFVPLLFLTFQRGYGLSFDKIALLISFNFGMQLLVDFLAAKFVDKIGYRICIVAAHIFAALGLAGLAIFPEISTNPFNGLVCSIMCYAVGGGLIEVMISPIVEACPTERKEAAMSLLHSFYCWGHVGVILLSTLFFVCLGVENWRYLACLWALIPLANTVLFINVPIKVLVEEEEQLSITQLGKLRIFWLLVIMMACAGASEQGMSQWASAFAEEGLHVSKTIGDLLGPCMFAAMMGGSRLFYAKAEKKIDLKKFMGLSCLMCVVSYLAAALSPFPLLALAGCGLCGMSVGILWPGTFSLATETCPGGGTAMFALLALAGDLGCAMGPAVVGKVADLSGGNLSVGLLTAIAFPIILVVAIWQTLQLK